ncbi:glucose-6-phosphate exchanger SLC37A4-like [Watersipora subatra]|uniref:glucose-6-phosphate exchanger SLC37A4-like n=1 Tax=Watersipora subatra TaxID=2589382 RepID=UPI00355AE7AD
MLLSGANGVAQGLGWPAVTKMIRAWYPPTQFGFWFAILTSAANGMSAVGPSIAAILSVHHGWQTAMHLPALLAIATSPFIIFCTWDKPSDVGYEDQLTLGGAEHGHWSDMVGSDFLMLLVSSFGFLFVVKTSCSEWGQVYLVEEQGVPYYTAYGCFTSIEVGGVVGSVTLGGLTDFMIRRGYYFGSGRSPRMIVVQLCAAGSCLFLNTFIFGSDPETSKTFISVVAFCMGFCLYGGIALIGTIAIEVAPIHMTGAAHAIIGLAANISSVIAGSPIQYMSQVWDWFTAFMLINITCLAAFLILIVGKNVPATYLEEPTDGPPRLREYFNNEQLAKFYTSVALNHKQYLENVAYTLG